MAMLTHLRNNTYLETPWEAQNILEMRQAHRLNVLVHMKDSFESRM